MTEKLPKVGANAPEKLYMIRADVGIKSDMFMLTSCKLDNEDIEYIHHNVLDIMEERMDKYLKHTLPKEVKIAEEQIKQDATKHIRQIYEKYKDVAGNSYLEFSELWQAIRNTIEDEEKGK